MNNISTLRSNILHNEIAALLVSKKNLMIYDGFSDNLEENIAHKFFYSNPYEPLEFINIDIYYKWLPSLLSPGKIKIHGQIAVIRDRLNYDQDTHFNYYGVVIMEEMKIRDVEKTKITLFIGDNGITDIEGLVDYFESNYCKKSYSSRE
jgi:hypothetical protein